ncbi:hypothetical protein EVAR_7131_1 [Eumeta japonica]|uniref:Uncharacterized protein n=1 Tax=Eumeta variegata TaxID=151549 RepID=A0A4C1U6K4_EUMVA|nr:hypothetical protein EVAR_7131_1 [Eumeta japonica]
MKPLTPPLDLRLKRENSVNWTPERGPSPLDPSGRIPDEKTPGYEATNKSSVPHQQPKRCAPAATNEARAVIKKSEHQRCP